ncbi:MAG TPA: hypothetical protein PKY12_14910 [Catalimonadaceae bacterium]|nr:hypothetical protein [Catalimonadaceae bacterium]
MNVPHIRKLFFEEDLMVWEADGFLTRIPLKLVSKKLLNANETDRAVFSISPNGYSIVWTKLGVRLAVSQILAKYGNQDLVEKMMKKKENS